uniref:LETM1 domain-containing protein 1 n=2 Tax=Cacopsylla melanoneura TaxID=428564 RepID=A0A8D8R602_9HEMI
MIRSLCRPNGACYLVSQAVKKSNRFILPHPGIYHQVIWRSYADETQPQEKKAVNPEVSAVKQFVFKKYFAYVQNYTANILEKQFPDAIRIYRVFSVGIKDFIADFKEFYSILNKINASPKGLPRLTRKELELYYQFPKDMFTIAPVLLISALPFMNYVMFPLAYMFPYQLLTHHFWSLQQKSEFLLREQKKRLSYNKSVFQHLQSQLDILCVNRLHGKWSQVISKLGSGLHPTTQEVLDCQSLFGHIPYSLNALSTSHVKSLLKIHAMHTGWRRKTRLRQKAKAIYLMDCAILREGGAEALNYDELRYACALRGLNPTNMRQKDMTEWLMAWLRITDVINPDNLSLVLHCPVLLAYNHTNNWILRRPSFLQTALKKTSASSSSS